MASYRRERRKAFCFFPGVMHVALGVLSVRYSYYQSILKSTHISPPVLLISLRTNAKACSQYQTDGLVTADCKQVVVNASILSHERIHVVTLIEGAIRPRATANGSECMEMKITEGVIVLSGCFTRFVQQKLFHRRSIRWHVKVVTILSPHNRRRSVGDLHGGDFRPHCRVAFHLFTTSYQKPTHSG